MCAGAASSQEEKPLTPKSGEALSSIACLRAFEAQFHFRGALAAIGGVLLLAGCFWAAVRFLTSQSYLIPILAGVVCIAISAAADPQGLLRHLPAEVRARGGAEGPGEAMAELGSVKRFVADPPEAEPETTSGPSAAASACFVLGPVLERPVEQKKEDEEEEEGTRQSARERFPEEHETGGVARDGRDKETIPSFAGRIFSQQVPVLNVSKCRVAEELTPQSGAIVPFKRPHQFQPVQSSLFAFAADSLQLRVAKVALDPHGASAGRSAVRYLERASSSDEDLDLDENFSPSTFAPSPAEMATDDEADSIGGKRCARARCPALTALIPDHIIRSTHSVSLNQRDAFADRTCVKDAPEYFTPNQRAIGRAVAFLTTIVLIVQDFLLNRRIFDIIHDDSPVTNAIRKWGRVQLLAMQSGSSEGVVREIVQSMGPDFVNFILCRSFLSFFPSLLQQLMLPEAPPLGADEGVSAGKSKSGLARTAARSDAWPQEDGREGAPPISWILRFLQQRNEAKMQKVTEPELLPLVVPNMLAALTERSRTFAHSLLHKLKVCAAAAGAGCVVYAATLFRGFGKKALLESLASGGLGVLVKDGEESRKKARLAAVLGLLSAGGAIVVGMSFERFNRRPKDPRSLQPSTDRPFEPEREASPPSSEVF
ncbi:hypothetical protein AK812_SmicGene27201 [Symbiodinium microadriaticum]|uniref:Transmembrane protein n=1 Tax=Symbiodinium microadriaticum TaxID=2951 RepID=A0A1Q9D7N0_SYMMI|nr:hypothetical protein AK812_SmicGene27201 [Symbiodinium microadriaticum]